MNRALTLPFFAESTCTLPARLGFTALILLLSTLIPTLAQTQMPAPPSSGDASGGILVQCDNPPNTAFAWIEEEGIGLWSGGGRLDSSSCGTLLRELVITFPPEYNTPPIRVENSSSLLVLLVETGLLTLSQSGINVSLVYCNQTFHPRHVYYLSITADNLTEVRLVVKSKATGLVHSSSYPASLLEASLESTGAYSVPPTGCKSMLLTLIGLGDSFLLEAWQGEALLIAYGRSGILPASTPPTGGEGKETATDTNGPPAPPVITPQTGVPTPNIKKEAQVEHPREEDDGIVQRSLLAGFARVTILLGSILLFISLLAKPRRRGG